ncbi:c411e416-c577-40d9-a0e2-fff812b44106 [Thermothielavioides terrestris]|uniref:C411e416-c577-40d9-a0e2-fff812b44106 n=1 Tax=Thermothielavioides terrestris TaxID=2587410 RepID=A0A3S4AKY3_9PEZI|nr:c411e416-c577-40d9-a0e2-fff812b44106 [Thermothielavioides terrestris]
MAFTTSPQAPRPLVLETITALGDLTEFPSSSQAADTDMDMRDADWIEQDGDGTGFKTAYPRSAFSDGEASLRGGAVYRRPDVAWLRKAAVASRKQDQPPSKEEDESDAVDYEDLDSFSSDDGYSTSSDWDSYGSLPLLIDEYDKAVARLEGNEDWNEEQKKLHKLIYMRGLHPMMPSWWRVSFKMWGVTQPHLDDVFTPKHSKKRVAIHAYGNEVAATKALESLFQLSQIVTDYEEIGYQSKISPTIVKGIQAYIKWAMRDAGIDKSRTLLNMLVQAYPPDFDDEQASEGSDYVPSPVSSNEEVRENNEHHDDDDDGQTEARQARRFTRAVSRDLERRLLNLGQRWRDVLRDGRHRGYIAQPPTLYAFAVIQHIVLLASHDSSEPTNPVVVLEQIRLNDRGQWLWNALSLALPVNMARDALTNMWDTGVIVAVQDDSASDPDL